MDVLLEMRRALIVTFWSIPSLLILCVVYVASYFALMAEGDTFNPDTFDREYRSYCRLAPSIRVPGNLSIYVTPTNWTNFVYYPMDRAMGRLHHSTNRRLDQ